MDVFQKRANKSENRTAWKMLSAFFTAFILSSCSMQASIVDLISHEEVVIPQKVSGNKEVVPVSQQGVVTSSGYRVQSSVSYYKGPSEVQTSQGYHVRTSVQSTLFRE
ncbi:MAG: hypothetical protein OM95_14880 [Bdellovibrio sp. ArHS]|uniref:hypothetical protein n=1 Tax=Bdellovibrio sp. ArHS TaxID=1569284 RepID=UPI00058298D7|nr:hypothetical protein [Bdellovibrio sp. ArHS]KHD87379.1 MAG: hypothetical protein OM95_14880 [Bdellovibrio sp. ArHS]